MTGRRGRVVKTEKQPQPHYEARESDSSNVDSLNIQEVRAMVLHIYKLFTSLQLSNLNWVFLFDFSLLSEKASIHTSLNIRSCLLEVLGLILKHLLLMGVIFSARGRLVFTGGQRGNLSSRWSNHAGKQIPYKVLVGGRNTSPQWDLITDNLHVMQSQLERKQPLALQNVFRSLF